MDKIVSDEQAIEAWKELQKQIGVIRSALHELDQVNSTLMVYLLDEDTSGTGE